MHFYPVQPNSGALAVSTLLVGGFISLLLIRKLGQNQSPVKLPVDSTIESDELPRSGRGPG